MKSKQISVIDERTRLRVELPHFRAHCRDGSCWALSPDHLESFRAAWTTGKAFWTGADIWHQTMDVKLADITAIVVVTDQSIALGEEEDEERKRREITS